MNLDAAQKQAVEGVEGPMMLIAGPGTGKTTTLIKRIEHLISQGQSPDEILALTFSEAAAGELRERIAKTLSIPDEQLRIFTYHGFAKWLIDASPSDFDLPAEPLVVNDVDRFMIIREALENMEIEWLTTKSSRDRFFYVRELDKKISLIKKEYIQKTEYFAELAKLTAEWEEACNAEKITKTRQKELDSERARIGKLEELWQIYEYYQARLQEMSAIDFEDMLGKVLDRLENNPEWRKQVADQFKFVLVDEYQDTNQAQNQLIFLLTKHADNHNVLVVGDDDQAIYGFQGASMRNVYDFLENFPEAKIISLESNFRSAQTILDLADGIISQSQSRLIDEPKVRERGVTKQIVAKNPRFAQQTSKPMLMEFDNRNQELDYIIYRINELHTKHNIPLNEMAILARTNAEGREISHRLFSADIPHAIGWSEDILHQPSVVRLMATLSTLFDPDDNESFFVFYLTPAFKTSLLDAVKISQYAKKYKLSMLSAFDRVAKNGSDWQDALSAQKARTTFYNLQVRMRELEPKDFVKLIIKLLKLEEDGEDKEMTEQALKTFLDKLDEFLVRPTGNSLADFTKHMNLAEKYNIEIKNEKDKVKPDAVSILTAHGAKGTEFQVVFVTNLVSQNWEGRTSRSELIKLPQDLLTKQVAVASGQTGEELRLLYVALTRAKEQLYLTFANRKYGDTFYASTLLAPALASGLLEHKINPPFTPLPKVKSESQLFDTATTSRWQKELQRLTMNYRFSASGLRDFRANRQLFKYKYIYQLAEEMPIHVHSGNAIHTALEEFVQASLDKQQWESQDYLLDAFTRAWDELKTGFPDTDVAFKTQESLETLTKTYDFITQSPIPSKDKVKLESWFEARIDDISVGGFLDRLEIEADGVRVIDYKSGKPESENEITGNTKTSDGTTYNQLLIYKILLEQNGYPVVKDGTILYLQDPAKSKSFDLKSADTKPLMEKIFAMRDLMKIGNFEPVDYEGKTQTTEQYPKLSKLNL